MWTAVFQMKLLLNKVFFRVSKHVGLWPLLLPARTFLPSEKRFLVVVQRIHCCWPPQKEDDDGPCDEDDNGGRSTEEPSPENEHNVTCYLEDEVANAKSMCNLDMPKDPPAR